MQKIAVLLTCYNRKEATIKCLNALYDCYLPINHLLDVFLVEDGCTDGTLEAVETKFPKVNIIQGNGNLYWNRGMHLAWKTAASTKDFDYYLWLNDDTYLFQNALEVLLSTANSEKNRSIVVAATCSKHTGKITYSGYDIGGNMTIPGETIKQITTFNGNCVLIPKFVYQKVGNLDPIFHHAIGDIDYGLRAKSKGLKSFVAPGVLANCEHHDTLPKWCISEIPFYERIKSLYSPLGNSHPYYFFRYEFRHFGIFPAFIHLLSIHLRVIIPKLWK